MPINLITPTAYARHRGCNEKSVRTAIAAGRISTINGRIDPVIADMQWAANTRARADSGRGTWANSATVPAPSEPASDGVDKASQARPALSSDYSVDRARRERYEADLAELKLREQQGDLVRVADVRAALATRLGNLRMALLQLPARVAPLLAAEADQAKVQAVLDAELRAVLTSVTREV